MSFRAGLNPGLKEMMSQPYAFDVVEANKGKAIEKFGEDYIIDFGVGDPTDSTPPAVREKCRAAVDDRKDSGYPESTGHNVFKTAVCDWMKNRFGVILSKEEVVATYGAKYSCFHIPLYFIRPGKGELVLVPNPGYPPYTAGTLLAGGAPYYLNILEQNDFEPDLGRIKERELKKARILFLNSPHSPTGRIYSEKKLGEIVDFCLKNKVILVSDECYSELYFGEKPRSILEIKGAEECSIVLNSLSKRSMMTGYSVGFLASKNPVLLRPFRVALEKSVQGVASFIQDAAVAAFSDEAHCVEMRRIYSERADALIPVLKGIGCAVEKPGGTFYLWARAPDSTDPVNFAEKLLLKKGINCTPGNLISHTFNGINPGSEYVRFALVPPVEKVREAAERLAK